MNRVLKYTLLSLLWGAVAAYIVYAALRVYAQRPQQQVTRMEIRILDSTAQGRLVSGSMVRDWIGASGIKTLKESITQVDLGGLERMIARNGFVEQAQAYVSYGGLLRIDIRQRHPILRLLTADYDAYLTSDGVIFAAPEASSLYVPVVTGSYAPPVPKDYTGAVRSYIDAQRRKIEARILEIGRENMPLYEREQDNDEQMRALRRMRVKKGWFERAESYDKKVVEKRREKDLLRRKYRYQAQQIQQSFEKIEQRQQAERLKQKNLEKSYEDLSKLITFVEFVENDDFWRAEVVQIVARLSESGALELTLIPRSGNHTILFGRIEQLEEKFTKLFSFYRRGLNNFGWEEYDTIDIRYKGQVVCRK